MAKKRILLTGASGTVGYNVLKQLYELKHQYKITVFDKHSPSVEKKFAPFANNINILYGDISKKAELTPACTNQDVVIHLAAIIPPFADEQPELAFRVNAEGTLNLVQCLEKQSPNTFLMYSSSISLYGDRIKNPYIKITDPIIPSMRDEYALTKIAAENHIQKSKLNWSIFRLAAIMGDHKISKIMFHMPLNTSVEICTPRDTARAFVNGIEHQEELNHKLFNLGGGELCRTTYEELLKRSFRIFGLGKLNFPPNTFAEKNFHCGYYADGDQLENIVHFRSDSLEDYFKQVKADVSTWKKVGASLFHPIIKQTLKLKSEPLHALKVGDEINIQRFFNAQH